MDVIILAGGKGSRMEDPLPKALVLAKNLPIIDHQLNYLFKDNQVNKIILAIGFKSDLIINHINKSYPSKSIDFSIETQPLGTGGAIRKALDLVDSSRVLILNCDDITDIDISKLNQITGNVLCVAHPTLPFGIVNETESGKVVFQEKPKLDVWVSCGWYLLNNLDLRAQLKEISSIEYDFFPNVDLNLYKHEGLWYPLNSKKDIKEFENKLD